MPEESRDDTTLLLLSAIEETQAVTQRSLSSRLGIAIGLTNAYIKRCLKKGLIKMSRAPARRYAYYLTPKGFSEKSRLTADYLARSFQFFRDARAQCLAIFNECEQRGWRRVILYGESDLAEIASLAARQTNVKLQAVVAPGSRHERIADLPVVARLGAAGAFDAIIITDIEKPQACYDFVRTRCRPERILLPPLLMISRVGEDQPGMEAAGVPGMEGSFSGRIASIRDTSA